MLTFATLLVAGLSFLAMLGHINKIEARVEELELVILNSRIEWVDDE